LVRIGITGGIGAGKTLVCKVFNTWGIPVFIADLEAKVIMDTDPFIKESIAIKFGKHILDDTGNLNRDKLSEAVFNNKPALDSLNAIVHPAVRTKFDAWVLQQQAHWVLAESAIMFESGMHEMFDDIIMVYSPVEVRIERVQKRNGFSKQKTLSIMANQMPDEEKSKKAGYVIHNNEKTLLLPQIITIYDTISKLQ
jgi:dephospho-CoA kinase